MCGRLSSAERSELLGDDVSRSVGGSKLRHLNARLTFVLRELNRELGPAELAPPSEGEDVPASGIGDRRRHGRTRRDVTSRADMYWPYLAVLVWAAGDIRPIEVDILSVAVRAK